MKIEGKMADLMALAEKTPIVLSSPDSRHYLDWIVGIPSGRSQSSLTVPVRFWAALPMSSMFYARRKPR